MMLSLTAAGAASESVDPGVIGFWSGILSSTTAIHWTWANMTDRLPEPARVERPDADEEIAPVVG
jgi:hypothetical protein